MGGIPQSAHFVSHVIDFGFVHGNNHLFCECSLRVPLRGHYLPASVSSNPKVRVSSHQSKGWWDFFCAGHRLPSPFPGRAKRLLAALGALINVSKFG